MSEQQQIAKLVAALVEHQQYFGEMSTEDRQWVIQNTKAAIPFFTDAVRRHLHFLCDEKRVLLEVDKYEIPQVFFKTRQGLTILSGFRHNILSVSKIVRSLKTSISRVRLSRGTNDTEMISKLPEGYVFEDPSMFCVHLVSMLHRQKNFMDNRDDLDCEGGSNNFYVRGLANQIYRVVVYWYSAKHGSPEEKKWTVDAYPFGTHSLHKNDCVFSANNVVG